MKEKKKQFYHRYLNEGATWQFVLKMFLLLFLVNVLIRLPLYFSKNFWFDGDEAIIGIMAQDFLRTGKLPFFFYGQHYGFASVETFFSAVFIKILGSKIIGLKLAGMVIHSLAMVFIALFLKAKRVSPRTWFFVLFLVLFFPPFYLWASQMRTTAFLLAAILLFIIETKSFSWWRFVLVFILSFLLLESQAMFFLFAMVFVGNWLWTAKRKLVPFAGFGLGQIVLIFLVNFYWIGDKTAHSVQLFADGNQWNQLMLQFSGFRSGFSGFHYFTMDIDLPSWYSVFILLMLGTFIGLFLVVIIRSWQENQRVVMFYGLALIGFLVFLSFFKEYGPRYWINFFGGTLLVLLSLLMKSETKDSLSKKMLLPLLPFIAVCFAASDMRVHFSDHDISEKEAFAAINHEVRASNQKAVFAADVYLQWQWNFINGEDVPCCAFIEDDRTDRFSKRVFSKYRTYPEQVGLMGYWGIFWEMDVIEGFNDKRYQVGEKYYFLKEIQVEYFKKGMKVSGD